MSLTRIKNITSRNLHFVFFLILIAFLLRFESYQPISENFLHYSNHSAVELVISYDSQEDGINDNFNQSQQKYEHSDLTNLPDLKFSLLYFNNYLNHKFISIELRFIQIQPYISIIQKNNIWHQNIYDVDEFTS